MCNMSIIYVQEQRVEEPVGSSSVTNVTVLGAQDRTGQDETRQSDRIACTLQQTLHKEKDDCTIYQSVDGDTR
jgi:hypothetical protein